MTHESENGEQTVCPDCGSPAHAGHMTGCVRTFQLEEAPSGSADEEAFFNLYEAHYNYRKPYNESTDHHLFVIKDDKGQVIAGEVIEISETEGRREAYFRMKVVRPEFQSKGLSSKLDRRGGDVAIMAGCTKAWGVADRQDPAAIRTIFKNGGVIKDRANKILGDEVGSGDQYYFSLDLTATPLRPVSIQEAIRARMVHADGDIEGDALLIPYQDETLIDIALSQGYVGRQLFLPKDWPETNPHTETFLYFEKSQSTTQDNPE